MQKKSFTLVELMIVIAILAILSAIVIFALNPARLFDNFRDSKRVTDISSINKAIVFMESWNQSGITYGTTTNVYISLPDVSTTCSSYTLPTLPTGYTYYCSSPASYRRTDGTGWIPINFTVSNSNNYLSSLPVDPVNNTTYFYTYYTGGSYELTAILANPNKNSINDEGSLTSTFEIGSPNRTWVTPLQRDKGLVLYYDFNETSGAVAYDKSGNGINGALTNGPVQTTTSYGEKNIYFDGINDYVATSAFAITNTVGIVSISTWINRTSQSFYQAILGEGTQNTSIGFIQIHLYPDTGALHLPYATGSEIITAYDNIFFDGRNNQWVLTTIILDYNNKNVKFYRNGVWTNTYNVPASILFPNVLRQKYIGSYSINSFFLRGYIDNFRIYNRGLSVEEMNAQYANTKSHYGL